jgi:hypothetical protein
VCVCVCVCVGEITFPTFEKTDKHPNNTPPLPWT